MRDAIRRLFHSNNNADYAPKPWALPWITEYWDGNSGITVTGSGVSAWAPVKGTHSFTQGTDSLRPTYSGGVLTFDGSDDWLKTGAFTLSQPFTVVMAGRSISWTNGDRWFDGFTQNTTTLDQVNSTPELNIYAGTFVGPVSLALGANGIVTSVFNGASSAIRLNRNTAVTGAAGANNAGGLTLGADGNNTSNANISVLGLCYANSALTTTEQDQTIQAMARLYGISV
jgi:hypothetical protein